MGYLRNLSPRCQTSFLSIDRISDGSDSLAPLDILTMGYGIRYEFETFDHQKMPDGWLYL